MSNYSTWADQELSAKLPSLREQGEGQSLEYKQFFPKQGWGLAQEIAAFATSNDGLILIGVADDGELIGLPDADTPNKRDALCRRVEGICTEVVAPSLTPSISFLQEAGQTVMAISVAKGPEPVYYCDGRPYLRHLSESRRARPHEVVRKVRESLGLPEDEPENPLAALAGQAADSVFRIIEGGATHEIGEASPNVLRTPAEFQGAADGLRSLAASDESVSAGWRDDLLTLADLADEAAEFPVFLEPESAAEKDSRISAAVECAKQLYDKRIDPVPVSKRRSQGAVADLRRNARELSQLAQRIEAEGGLKKVADIQLKVGLIGFYVQARAWWGLHHYPRDIVDPLRSVARKLCRTESLPVFADGGISEQAIVRHIVDSANELAQLLPTIEAESQKPTELDAQMGGH